MRAGLGARVRGSNCKARTVVVDMGENGTEPRHQQGVPMEEKGKIMSSQRVNASILSLAALVGISPGRTPWYVLTQRVSI